MTSRAHTIYIPDAVPLNSLLFNFLEQLKEKNTFCLLTQKGPLMKAR